MPRSPRRLWLAAALALATAAPAAAQSTYTWNGAGGGQWLTTSNWTGGPAGTYPGTSAAAGAGSATDIARFSNASATVGIDMTSPGRTPTVRALDHLSTTNLTIGNSSTTNTGILQLNGATINSVPNTLVNVTSANLTFTNTGTAGGNQAMGVQLGTTNGVFNVAGDGTINRTLAINGVL